MNPKIIRDPIYDYISIETKKDGWLLDLLNTREVQRLRHIHQLGVSYLVYPGATHTRFSHALGVMHLMQLALQHVADTADQVKLTQPMREALLAAAVVHDIGHGPFSHLLESKLGDDGHEEWSRQIFLDGETEVFQVLRKRDIADQVAALLKKEGSATEQWQQGVISSQLDVDRMDYLLRDSHFTGVSYGKFDYYRLIHTMLLERQQREKGQRQGTLLPVWPEKTGSAIEEYVFSRFYMYQSVYFHPCTRGYEKLLEAIWQRALDLSRDGKNLISVDAMKPFFGKKKPSVNDFLRLTDYQVLAQVAAWQEKKSTRDAVLSDLCGRFMNRRGFKVIKVKERKEGFDAKDRLDEVEEYYKGVGGNERKAWRCYLLEDKGGVVPYKPYKWGEKEHDPILLSVGGKPEEICNVVRRLRSVTKEEERFIRYYCPEEHKKELSKILCS